MDKGRKETTAVVLARIEERLNNFIDSNERQLDQILQEAKKTNGRVTAIEFWKNKIKGAWAMLVLVATGAGAIAGIIATYLRG